jgi:hypothetical protein
MTRVTGGERAGELEHGRIVGGVAVGIDAVVRDVADGAQACR